MPQRSALCLLPAIVASGLLGFGSAPAIARSLTGSIVSVGDGDTIRVKTADQKTLTVRLSCINAAELAQKPYGEAAAARLKQLLPVRANVRLAIADTDRYGRSVATVYRGDLAINLAMVQEGQTVVYQQYLSACPELKEALLGAQAAAKSRRRGFWAQTNPVMPWDFRHSGQKTGVPKVTSPSSQPNSLVRPAGNYNCTDFKTQAEAQRIFNAYPGDPFRLDRDGMI